MGTAGVLIASSVFFANEKLVADAPVPVEIASGKSVIYFTAGNCKSCERFEKKGGEAKLQKLAEAKGIKFLRKTAEDRVHLKYKNVYGEFTQTFRQASDVAGHVTAPTFAFLVDGEVVTADFGSSKSVMDAVAAN